MPVCYQPIDFKLHLRIIVWIKISIVNCNTFPNSRRLEDMFDSLNGCGLKESNQWFSKAITIQKARTHRQPTTTCRSMRLCRSIADLFVFLKRSDKVRTQTWAVSALDAFVHSWIFVYISFTRHLRYMFDRLVRFNRFAIYLSIPQMAHVSA